MEEWGHQYSYKTFYLQFVLPAEWFGARAIISRETSGSNCYQGADAEFQNPKQSVELRDCCRGGRDRPIELQPEGFTVVAGASCSLTEAEVRPGLAGSAGLWM